MSTVWKGTLSFGLLTIPVKLSVAAREETVSFNLLHTCGSRINQKTWCPKCEKEIQRNETEKAFEIEKGKYVTITPEELKALTEESNKTIEITEMVPAEKVDPLLFEKSYYVEPESAGAKAYKLLVMALEAEKKFAIAKVTMSSREQIIVIRPHRGQVVLHTIFYADEVRSAPGMDLTAIEVNQAELKLARQLVTMNEAAFEHQSYSDAYRTSVMELIRKKGAGETIDKIAPKSAAAPVVDIMAALEASLKTARKKPAKKAA